MSCNNEYDGYGAKAMNIAEKHSLAKRGRDTFGIEMKSRQLFQLWINLRSLDFRSCSIGDAFFGASGIRVG